MSAKEKEAKEGTTELTIWMNLPNLDAKDFQLASSAYVSKLFAAIREYMNVQVPLGKLVVQTEDADNKPYPLDNAKLTLGEALCNSKRNSKGEYDIYVEVPEVPKAGKSFAKNGVPPLADRCGSTSEGSVNEAHAPAEITPGTFGILEGIKLEGGRRLWTTYEQDGELAWGTAKDIQEYLKPLLMDAIASVGLAGQVKNDPDAKARMVKALAQSSTKKNATPTSS